MAGKEIAMTWVLSETSGRIKSEIAEKRPLRWGDTRVAAAVALLVITFVAVPVVAQPLASYVGKVLCSVLLFMGVMLAFSLAHKLARQGEWDLKEGLKKLKKHTGIGYTSVWMLREGGGLELRIDPRDRRETDKDTGKWVLDVPLGGLNPEPAILRGRTNNPIEGLTVVRVIWNDGPVSKVVVGDRAGNRMTFDLEALLFTLEHEYCGWDTDQRLEWLVGKLARDSKSLLERDRQYRDAVETIERQNAEIQRAQNLERGFLREADQLKGKVQRLKEYLHHTSARYRSADILLESTLSFLGGFKTALANVTRLTQRAPKEVAQLRDLLVEHTTVLKTGRTSLEEDHPKVMTIEELRNL